MPERDDPPVGVGPGLHELGLRRVLQRLQRLLNLRKVLLFEHSLYTPTWRTWRTMGACLQNT